MTTSGLLMLQVCCDGVLLGPVSGRTTETVSTPDMSAGILHGAWPIRLKPNIYLLHCFLSECLV